MDVPHRDRGRARSPFGAAEWLAIEEERQHEHIRQQVRQKKPRGSGAGDRFVEGHAEKIHCRVQHEKHEDGRIGSHKAREIAPPFPDHGERDQRVQRKVLEIPVCAVRPVEHVVKAARHTARDLFDCVLAPVARGARQLVDRHIRPSNAVAMFDGAGARLRPVVVPHIECGVHVIEVVAKRALVRCEVW